MALNKAWIKIKNRSSSDYVNGVDSFLDFALSSVREEERETVTIRCPCNSCRNIFFKRKCDVRFDLLKWGMYEKYTSWEFHGETSDHISEEEHDNNFDNDDTGFRMLQDACGLAGMNVCGDDQTISGDKMAQEPNADAQKFYRLLKDYEEPLTVDGKSMSKLSYIVKLLHLKVLNKWSDSSFTSLLKLQREAYGTSLPDSYYEAKKLIKDLGLECLKIDACRNDCILYWKEYENSSECPTCGLSRWKSVNKGSRKGVNVPHKVLRYFPLKQRLQRLYMSRKTTEDMQWHKKHQFGDNIMRHPRDSLAWKSVDVEYTEFAEESRNVRLGLACDGFQPFDNSQHSIWPVVLIPYNLPPWICMKPQSFMLTLLIPGPTSPGRNIDVFLQPLIEELKELWEVGVETYDAFSKENFKMHAVVLWTINDFPAYGDLAGWTTKGHFACPCCHKETKRTSLMSKGGYLHHRRWLPLSHKWRKDACSFNNKKEKGRAPVPLRGDQVLDHLSHFVPDKFGKASKKRKRNDSNRLYGWNKKSIFFELPYWSKLKIRHNLDVMHIEKNVSDNILGTLMGIKGKSKDARHLVNECGRVVRTKAPLNVKNWKEALSVSGDSMWKEIQDKFQVSDSSCNLKMYNFVIDTMQRLYRLWKCRLHYYYKSPKCGKTDLERLNNPPPDLPQEQWEWCVSHYGSDEFKIVSQRNSKNRLSENRCVHTTGNLAFVEVEDMMIKENNGVKPSADVIWLLEHTHTNKEDKLEWADGTRSKIVHEKLKEVVATAGDSMTQEEILTHVLEPRSGYVRGKGTALRGYTKGKHQLEQQRQMEQQQGKIQEQDQRIKELEEIQQKQQQELEESQRKQQQELKEYKAQQQQAMEDFKREMMEQLLNRGLG